MVNNLEKYRNYIDKMSILRLFFIVMLVMEASTNSHIEPDVGKGICYTLAVIIAFDFMLYLFTVLFYKRLNE